MPLLRRPRNRVLNNNNNPIQSVGRDNANSSFKYDIYRAGDGRVRYEILYCRVDRSYIQYNNIHCNDIDGRTKYYMLFSLPKLRCGVPTKHV
jgi:hypothetical protein